ncbi:phosphate transporter [Paraprevotella clara]|uniref:inorganic phosphate transporter n=1 Tax=Paraprevotella clara TaxID=454154 RepID=UPI0024906C27|nr:inorganic phosphate transporter [Paraprevotella clara]BDI75348.1 phosphate transporter [Paraprevotella clara]
MEIVYFSFIVFLFMLAVFDLVVGVSNDAVNFLNSAIGAKVARFRTILIIASIGVFVGATMSNGMMDIARHGIFQPQMFSFNDLLCIFLAVMVTDVVLLDVFNTLGMPTSTTVSMVFELLGGTFILSLLKIATDETGLLGFADLLNTDKALSVILGIFLSVAVAFIFGTVVQWLSRLIFTFNYTSKLKWKIGLFGGIATTCILYFALLKGLKDSSFMTPEYNAWIKENTMYLVGGCFVVSTVLMQVFHWCKINVFKIVIFMGTFALALAFAGNDLVNFVGVPLAAYSAYQDFAANGAGQADTFMMSSLNESAKTPFIFLFLSGVVMVYALATSKKAQNVVKTSVDLSRQDEGEEMFGSSRVARSIVRGANNVNEFFSKYTPKPLVRWIDARFNKDEAILAQGAAFDLVRASINLVLSGLLIALGTSLKLPLSTTYVTFIVAMGSSLADRAWSRESAVFRITGVLNVIGGWFLTAGIAFSACALVTIAMYYGGAVVMALFVFVAVFILIKSNISTKRKDETDYEEQLFKGIMNAKDKAECWDLLKKHVCATQQEMLDFVWKTYEDVVNGFVDEDLKTLRRAVKRIDAEKSRRKKLRQRELVGMRRIDKRISLEKNTWFHLASNSGEQMLYCLKRMSEPCKEHVDNNFNPLSRECIEEILPVKKKIVDYLMRSERIVEDRDYEHIDALLAEEEAYKQQLSEMRRAQEDRIQMDLSQGLKVSLVYLNLLQETQELLSDLRHYLRAFKRFQQ